MNRKLSTALRSAAMLGFAAFSIFAQQPRANFDRPQTFDAQHYLIRTSFDRQNKKVIGDTTVTLKPLRASFRTFDLDAVGLKFESIRLEPEAANLQYTVSAGKVSITLPKIYGPDDTVSVRLRYTAEPKKGVYFVEAASGRSAQIWTQGEPDEARHWFPCFDFPSDKATTEQFITAPTGETVVGNGELVDKSENTDGTVTWHYKMPVPHSTYLVSFVIGQYSRVDDTYKDIPLGFYIYPGREATARRAFGDTKRMMAVYEQLTGVAFPYNKYDQTVVANFQFGGMENITATTMSDMEIFFADVDFLRESFVIDLVSHELAHSWFGDLVTCRNWAELWLNEGFATYMEAAYREKAFGRDDYMRKVRTDAANFLTDEAINKKRHALYNLRAGDVSSLFDNSATTYHKGGAVLHTLREQVGTDAFWKALNNYLNRHRFGNVGSTDLKAVMEEASGQDLDWFFDQWVYGGGAPKLDVRQTYRARTRTLTVTISQTQGDAITPSVFRLPMDVVIKSGAGEQSQKIEMTKRIQSFTFKTDRRPVELVLDPSDKIPLKRLKIHPLVTPR
jgi:aminopeptidase N